MLREAYVAMMKFEVGVDVNFVTHGEALGLASFGFRYALQQPLGDSRHPSTSAE